MPQRLRRTGPVYAGAAGTAAVTGTADGAPAELGDGLTERAPEFLAETLRESVDSFFENGSVVAEKGYAALFSLASSTIAGLPDLFLFLVTTVLASFMICSQYEAIWAFGRPAAAGGWQKPV